MPNSMRKKNEDVIWPAATLPGAPVEKIGATGAQVRCPKSFFMLDLLEQTALKRGELPSSSTSSKDELPARSLNSRTVRPSPWANRHPSAFSSKEYRLLKEEIRSSGGNVQPIKVRPIAARALRGATDAIEEVWRFEIVYGHRRHQACLELGLKVLAVIEDLTDAELFTQMDRENRQRENLSPWEQGAMYARALDAGLFPSMRQLAQAVGCNTATISRAVALARLPDAIVGLFRSPTDIQTRWAKALNELAQQDLHIIKERTAKVASRSGDLSPMQVYTALVEDDVKPAMGGFNVAPERATLCHGGRRIGEVLQDARRGTTVRFYKKLPLPMFSAVAQSIQWALNKF